jgi:hypothetical protein
MDDPDDPLQRQPDPSGSGGGHRWPIEAAHLAGDRGGHSRQNADAKAGKNTEVVLIRQHMPEMHAFVFDLLMPAFGTILRLPTASTRR